MAKGVHKCNVGKLKSGSKKAYRGGGEKINPKAGGYTGADTTLKSPFKGGK